MEKKKIMITKDIQGRPLTESQSKMASAIANADLNKLIDKSPWGKEKTTKK